MVKDFLKKILFIAWPKFYQLLPKTTQTKSLNDRIVLSKLKIKDPLKWRLEKAKKMGIRIGDNCRLYSLNVFSEPYLVEIGDNVIVSGQVMFITHDGSVYTFKEDCPNVVGHFGTIKIGNNCFIGMRSMIMPNVEIGNNCIVGAGAVVNKSFPDNSVIIGNPARVAFKLGMYKKFVCNSPCTVIDERYEFPKDIPPAILEKILTEHFQNIKKCD
jgi:acetyltransferase-like isoleucine patch superfamily enzyme